MNDLLFAVPWWIPSLLAVIGIALFVNGNKSQVDKLRNAGAGLVALAILWSLMSYFIDTDKEKVEKGTRELLQSAVDATTNGDWPKFKAKLTPSVLFKIGGGSVSGDEMVTNVCRQGCEMIKLKSAQAREVTVDETGTFITVHCEIFTTQEYAPPMETSTWDFDWQKTSTGWKVQNIRLLKIKDVGPDQLDSIPVQKLKR